MNSADIDTAHQHAKFAELITTARRIADMTAAEFDYSLANSRSTGYRAHQAYDMAGPVITNDYTTGIALTTRYRPQLTAMAEAAQAKSYEGWSRAAQARGQRIRYASTGPEDEL